MTLLLLVMVTGSYTQLVTTTLEQRQYKQVGNYTYCVYNQYNDTNVIYECVNRTKAPINDSSCLYEIDIKNYICSLSYDYPGEIECMFDYDSDDVWGE